MSDSQLSPNEAFIHAKNRLMAQGQGAVSLSENETFKTLLAYLDERVKLVKDEALEAKSFEVLLEKRGEIAGLQFVGDTITTMIKKGQSARKALTSK